MANITEFTKIMKLPKLALMTYNPSICLKARYSTIIISKCLFHMKILNTVYSDSANQLSLSSSSSLNNSKKFQIFVKQQQRETFSIIKSNNRYYSNTNHPPIITAKNYKSDNNINKNKETITTIDEFRAREEQKDEEYLKQQHHQKIQLENEENYDYKQKENIENVRIKILESSLQFVNSYGWTRKTISYGAETIGYPGIVHGIFPDGGIELIRYFYSKCNNELVEKLKIDTNNGEIIIKEQLEFLIDAVKKRLQMIEPYSSHWPQALAIMSLPQNVPKSLAQLLTLVDDICYYSGDRSVDFGWYTRRIGLATIYKMTELYMLQDSSINHDETWIFLRKRMEEASNFEAIITNSDGLTQNVQQKLISAFETARNILGLDLNRK